MTPAEDTGPAGRLAPTGDEAATEARRMLKTFELAAVGLAHVSPEGTWLRVNDRACEITGYTAEELTGGMTFQQITHPEDLEDDVSRAQALVDGQTGGYSMEKRYVRKDGSLVWVLLSVTLVHDERGEPEFFVSVIEDIDARKAAERAAALSAALNEIDEAINSSHDFDSIMRGLVDASAIALGAETAAVTLRDGDDWVITHKHGFPDDFVGVRLSSDELPHAALAVRSRSVVAIDDARTDPRTRHDVIRRFDVRSVMVVPLHRAGEVYGAIFFNHSSQPVPFTPEQQDFGRKLAAHVSLAVENARLFEAEKRIAETLQEGLLFLPSEVPGVEYAHEYRSSSDTARVGGDFYDVFELDSGALCFVIGDVSGKGLDAAMLTARVKSTLRAESATGDRTPADVISRLNELLYRDTDAGVFVTVFLGVFDRGTGALVYASGGHTTGIIVRHDGGVDRLSATGPIVGAFAELRFENARLTLEPADTLLLYTDGVIEARAGGELYGEERLVTVVRAANGVPPAELVDRALLDVGRFADALTDDLAIMAIRWPSG